MASQDGTSYLHALMAVVASISIAGCAGVPVVPPDLEGKIERNVSFQQVSASPLLYQGKFIVAGGIVLSVKLTQDGTRIEILQLPLASDQAPQG